VNVWSPQNLSNEEKAMLEKLKQSANFQPGPDAKNHRDEKSFFDKIKDAFG